MANKKLYRWWEKDDYTDYKYDSGKGASSWMRRIGGYYDDWWRPKSKQDPKEVYQKLLRQLQNSANLIGSNETGVVTIKWGNNEKTNEPTDGNQVIYLSPDNLILKSKSETSIDQETLDAMTGKVYLASTLRETVAPNCYSKAKEIRSNLDDFDGQLELQYEMTLVLWEAFETAIARSFLLENWVGFASYIAADISKSHDAKQEVQEFISNAKPNLKSIVTAIGWNLLYPNDPVSIPDCEEYDKCLKMAKTYFEGEIQPEDRFFGCNQLVKEMQKLFKISPKSQQPKICDTSLLGTPVSNKTGLVLDDMVGQEREGLIIRGDIPSDCDDSGLECKIQTFDRPAQDAYEIYNRIVSENRNEIRTVSNSLMFRNNVNSIQSFGHRSGDIDENSLYKLKMSDDRLMMRTDIESKKKIAIGILIDESGSMDHACRDVLAREVAVVLGESLKNIRDISLSIYGHTAETNCNDEYVEGVVLREYYSPRQLYLQSCVNIEADSQNLDSFAIMHFGNIMLKDYPHHERRIMFVVSDGLPEGSSYGGKLAITHMNSVVAECYKHKVEVYGIGIDRAFDDKHGIAMYGENRFVVLQDVKSSINIMSRFIKQVAMSRK